MKSQNGFTLLELMACLAIISFLAVSAIPVYQNLIMKKNLAATVNAFIIHIKHARSTAQAQNSAISICKSNNGTSCEGNWQDGLLSFTDANQNGRPDENDQILNWTLLEAQRLRISWRAFTGRRALTFPGTGRFKYNGSFTFCPTNGNPHFARQLSINITGRIRQQEDSDLDGIVDDRSGNPLPCNLI